MAKKYPLKIKNVRKALKDTGGILTLIAKKLDVDRSTLYNFIAKHPEINEDLHHEREKIIDLAEGSLFSQVQNKEAWATKYVLSTIGKNRGYVERIESINFEPREIKVVFQEGSNEKIIEVEPAKVVIEHGGGK